jgi:DNA-binding NtrC family response regulator
MFYTQPMRKKVPGWIDNRVKLFERRCLERVLRKTGGNVRQAALMTDTRRVRLYKMMKEHGLKISDFRTDHADPR